MFGYDRLLAMNTGVEGGETALKLARSLEIFFETVSFQSYAGSFFFLVYHMVLMMTNFLSHFHRLARSTVEKI